MAYFDNAEEVYKYIGGVFRATNDSEVGPKLCAADIDLQVYYTEPECKLTLKLHAPLVEVVDGGDNEEADVKLFMTADTADKFWRGEYNLGVGLAKGHVKAMKAPRSGRYSVRVAVTGSSRPVARSRVGRLVR